MLKPLVNAVVNPPLPEKVAIMIEVLSEYPQEKIAIAIYEAIRSFEFWPAPVKMIELIQDPNNNPEHYWNQILQHARRVGVMGKKIELPDHAKRALENVGGIEAVGMCEKEKLGIISSQFKKACSTFSESSQRHEKALSHSDASLLLENIGKRLGKPVLG